MYEPWEGSEYESTRLLLLGESAYSWEEDGEIIAPKTSHCRQLVNWAITDFEGCRSGDAKVPFIVTLSRALTCEEHPSKEALTRAWNKVAFTNLVDETVGVGPNQRPSKEMWQRAQDGFTGLLRSLEPSRVVVLGKQLWSHLPLEDFYVSDDCQGYIVDGRLVMCWAVTHPSRLGWRELASIMQFACGSELRAWESHETR